MSREPCLLPNRLIAMCLSRSLSAGVFSGNVRRRKYTGTLMAMAIVPSIMNRYLRVASENAGRVG